ncbi:hypothetical protein OUZ56_011507 [Daphnia magna]|uniref:Uncharacterized protein n=1 Tax=Daphnia magna TaxID=35525 RepID=A0ABQ9Z0F4_9CRUS|nr:hypothetical protein OUZ56_011507 [Daphnia magna]
MKVSFCVNRNVETYSVFEDTTFLDFQVQRNRNSAIRCGFLNDPGARCLHLIKLVELEKIVNHELRDIVSKFFYPMSHDVAGILLPDAHLRSTLTCNWEKFPQR